MKKSDRTGTDIFLEKISAFFDDICILQIAAMSLGREEET